jgi:hypothetical protein
VVSGIEAVLREGADFLWDAAEDVTDDAFALCGSPYPADVAQFVLRTMSGWLTAQADVATRLLHVGKFDPAEFKSAFALVAQFPIDLDSRVVAGYLAGSTIKTLAELHPYTQFRVRTTLLAKGVKLRPAQRIIPASPPGLGTTYLAGANIRDTAALFDLSPGMTRRMLLRDKVKLRPRGGS